MAATVGSPNPLSPRPTVQAAPCYPAGPSDIIPGPSSPSSPQCNPSSLSSSPRQYSADFSHPILEEGAETESESPIEPVTPVSGRQSREFTAFHTQDNPDQFLQSSSPPVPPSRPAPKAPLVIETAPTPSPRPSETGRSIPPGSPPPIDQNALTQTTSRRQIPRTGSSFRLKRTMSNMSSLFRRSSSQTSKDFELDAASAAASEINLNGRSAKVANQGPPVAQSSRTSRSNSPPSPTSPLEMAPVSHEKTSAAAGAQTEEAKKPRAATGFTLRNRAVNFVSGNGRDTKRPRQKKRASSFDGTKKGLPPPGLQDYTAPAPAEAVLPDRLPWAFPPDAGTGAKARRMSLSLPDDFFVDVAELTNEYEYQQKFLGRHAILGKGALGKGATAKVIIMVRKGSPGELYAVKEFRGKSRQETQAEYEKKIKSEYSIAKSLHHPNIVETIRLCTHHSRWNHVMEYCTQGDLHSLVQKGYLKEEARQKDRQCLFKQLLQGVNYLHSNGIAHRDIKLENLLITQDSKLKITDFGVSEVFSGTHPGLREAGGVCGKNMCDVRLCNPGICGSEPFIAPEVLAKDGQYDPRGLDVWGMAITMICLIAGGNLWTRAAKGQGQGIYDSLVSGWEEWDEKHADTEDKITDVDYPNVEFFDRFVKPPALRRILLQMLNPNPAKRITTAEVVNNRWVKNVECCQLESYEDPTPIDASKKNPKLGKRIYCHNHLPAQSHGTHSLGAMPGKPGY